MIDRGRATPSRPMSRGAALAPAPDQDRRVMDMAPGARGAGPVGRVLDVDPHGRLWLVCRCFSAGSLAVDGARGGSTPRWRLACPCRLSGVWRSVPEGLSSSVLTPSAGRSSCALSPMMCYRRLPDLAADIPWWSHWRSPMRPRPCNRRRTAPSWISRRGGGCRGAGVKLVSFQLPARSSRR